MSRSIKNAADPRGLFPSIAACLVLAVTVLVVFAQVREFEFIDYDDGDYVAKNQHVQQGLTSESMKWAFTSSHAANWHPITWLSHMLDWTIYGNHAGGHHFTNVLLHIANALLILLLLKKYTGAFWRSVFVASLFALHPLHVESVAWVAERKDVLSTFFGLLAILAYRQYAECRKMVNGEGVERGTSNGSRTWFYYGLTLLLFCLGLMCKPMLVTLPFVFLLLDYWPLQRWGAVGGSGVTLDTDALKFSRPKRLVGEKIPFLIISAASCFVTVKVQSGKTVQSLTDFSIVDRISNVLVSYATYIGKMLWPEGLTFFYPLIKAPPLSHAVFAAFVLSLITFIVVRFCVQKPYLVTGWFWYLGTLVPVIGLVHVGEQSHADRYTYIPSIGFFIALAWGAAEFVRRRSIPKSVAIGFSAVVVIGCAILTWKQIGYWRNNRVMLERALAVTKDNFLAHNNYGVVLADAGRRAEEQGKAVEAAALFDEAVGHYLQAIRIKPAYARAYNNLGSALTLQNKLDGAVENFERALSIRPDAQTHHNLALALARQKKYKKTIEHCREALRLDPAYTQAHYDLGLALSLSGQLDAAEIELRKAVQSDPNDWLSHYQLANTLLKLGKTADAVLELRETARLNPGWADGLGRLAWILATAKDDSLRNGTDALKYAAQAADLTGHQHPFLLSALAAAYAESGNFEEAINIVQNALALAERNNHSELARAARSQLAAYQTKTPWRSQ